MSNEPYRQQGDVLFFAVDAIPAGAKRRPAADRVVFAEGEATGHAHATTDPCEVFELYGALYCDAQGDITVRHEEHGTVTLPAGRYRIGIVQEYDHFAEEARNVAD